MIFLLRLDAGYGNFACSLVFFFFFQKNTLTISHLGFFLLKLVIYLTYHLWIMYRTLTAVILLPDPGSVLQLH